MVQGEHVRELDLVPRSSRFAARTANGKTVSSGRQSKKDDGKEAGRILLGTNAVRRCASRYQGFGRAEMNPFSEKTFLGAPVARDYTSCNQEERDVIFNTSDCLKLTAVFEMSTEKPAKFAPFEARQRNS
jgi:hypothetical protein